jgi:hypothetical protein
VSFFADYAKIEKIYGAGGRIPGIRWRVVNGASPNVARYVSAKRPSSAKPKAAGNFCDFHHVGSGVAQRTADSRQPTQQQILGRAHVKKFGTAQAKGPVADRDQRAQFWHPQRPAEMLRQHLLEPDHDPGMTALGVVVGPSAGGRQTGDQHLDQTLFHRPRDLEMGHDLGLCLAEAADSRMQASQTRRNAPRGL